MLVLPLSSQCACIWVSHHMIAAQEKRTIDNLDLLGALEISSPHRLFLQVHKNTMLKRSVQVEELLVLLI